MCFAYVVLRAHRHLSAKSLTVQRVGVGLELSTVSVAEILKLKRTKEASPCNATCLKPIHIDID